MLLDTNVVVAALLWNGPPALLVEQAVEQELELFTSIALLAELRATLGYAKFAKRMAALRTNVEALLREYEVIATVVHPGQVPRVVAADADDDRVIAAAVTARVDLIVSGDRHLLNLGSHQGIAIVSVRQAIERIAQARDQ